MINGLKIFCVILARGDSKGIYKKNIYPLSGKPLIYYTINQCMQSMYIDRIVVSTDDDAIKEESIKYCEVIDRPKYLSDDKSPSEESIIHAIKKYKEKSHIVLFPQVTHPIRRVNLIDLCIEKYVNSQCDSLITVKSFSPFFAHVDQNNKVYFNNKSKIIHRKMRQDYTRQELFYYDAGNLYLIESDMLIQKKDRIGLNPVLFKLYDYECIDIHNLIDVKIANVVMEYLNGDI